MTGVFNNVCATDFVRDSQPSWVVTESPRADTEVAILADLPTWTWSTHNR